MVHIRKVLIIAYYWPPLGGIGMKRAAKLALYLPRSGWDPVVLTPAIDSQAIAASPAEAAEVAHVPVVRQQYRDRLRWVRRAGGPRSDGNPSAPTFMRGRQKDPIAWVRHHGGRFLKELFDYPDAEIGWLKGATATGISAVQKHGIDLVFSTSPPVTGHMVARQVARATGLPWVADLRDLWTQNVYYPYSPTRRWLERRLEQQVLADADLLLTVSTPLAGELARLHPGHRGRIQVMTNGFDPSDFTRLSPRQPDPNRLVIAYTGTLYGGARDPSPLLQALRHLVVSQSVDPERILFRIVGPDPESLLLRARDLGVEKIVQWGGTLPYHDTLQQQVNAHVLLLIEQEDPAARGIYTGKVFEYLGARRPILGLVRPDSVVADLLQDTGAGRVSTDPEMLARWTAEWYREWQETGDVAWTGRDADVGQFTRQAGARLLGSYFDQVVADSVRNRRDL